MLEKMNKNIENHIVDKETREMFLEWKRQCYIECAKEEGREIGEQKSKIKIAKKLKTKGFSNKEIKELTDLSKEDIEYYSNKGL